MIDLVFFLPPVLPGLAVVVGFFVTFVDVLANDDVVFGLAGAGVGTVTVLAAGLGFLKQNK